MCIVELYKHTGIFKNMREVHRKAQASCSRVLLTSVLKNSQLLSSQKCIRTKFLFFFYKMLRESRAQTRDIDPMFYGAIMNSN